jgi:hypothetical protein
MSRLDTSHIAVKEQAAVTTVYVSFAAWQKIHCQPAYYLAERELGKT